MPTIKQIYFLNLLIAIITDKNRNVNSTIGFPYSIYFLLSKLLFLFLAIVLTGILFSSRLTLFCVFLNKLIQKMQKILRIWQIYCFYSYVPVFSSLNYLFVQYKECWKKYGECRQSSSLMFSFNSFQSFRTFHSLLYHLLHGFPVCHASKALQAG